MNDHVLVDRLLTELFFLACHEFPFCGLLEIMFAPLFQLILLLGLGYGLYFSYTNGMVEMAKQEPDSTLVVGYWGAMILCSVGLGAIFALRVAPKIGEWMASLFYSAPGEQVEKSPHSAALAKIATGDYAAAVVEYEKVLSNDPEDIMALVEISRLYIERLEDAPAAAARLEQALGHDWEKEKVAPLTFRLAEIYWKHLGDPDRARAILEQVVELMPESTHSANAAHRIREIDEKERARQEAEFLASHQEAGIMGMETPAPQNEDTVGSSEGDQDPFVALASDEGSATPEENGVEPSRPA